MTEQDSSDEQPLSEREVLARADALLRPPTPVARRLNRNVLTIVAVLVGVVVIVALVTIRQPRANTIGAKSTDAANTPAPAPPPFFEQPSDAPVQPPVPQSSPLAPGGTSRGGPTSALTPNVPTEGTPGGMSGMNSLYGGTNPYALVPPVQPPIPPPAAPSSPREDAYRAALKSLPFVDWTGAGGPAGGTAGARSSNASHLGSPLGVSSTVMDSALVGDTVAPDGTLSGGTAVEANPMARSRTSGGLSAKAGYQSFLTTAAIPSAGGNALRSTVEPVRSPYLVQAGTVIPGLLVTGVSSDLPGQMLGQVSRDVYDSPTERVLLIPKGSKLVGKYDNDIIVGQNRLLVAWTRIIFPDGRSITLPGLGITDNQGASGVKDRVDNHYRTVFGHALLLSIIGAGVQLSQPRQAYQGPYSTPSAGQVAAGAVGQEFDEVASDITRRNLAIQPTITIRQGTPFNIVLNGDLTFVAPYTDLRQ